LEVARRDRFVQIFFDITVELELIDARRFDAEDSSGELEISMLSIALEIDGRISERLPLSC